VRIGFGLAELRESLELGFQFVSKWRPFYWRNVDGHRLGRRRLRSVLLGQSCHVLLCGRGRILADVHYFNGYELQATPRP
jgi:hypothetical protein